MEKAKTFFTKEDIESIKNAIRKSEMKTSGELRVHIENTCAGKDVLDRASEVFAQLKMHKTKQRNGVLFYLAVQDHKFAILGDGAINSKVPENFWDDIKDQMAGHFKKMEFTQGLAKGVTMAGEQLQTHFPYQRNDINELPDEISFG